MPDPQTVNLQLNVPAHLSDPGAWDTPLNANFQVLDTVWGGVATIPISGTSVTLTPAQWQCQMLIFTGTLTADAVAFLPALGSHHSVCNRTTGNFNMLLSTGTGGARFIALPPNEWVDILTDGSNVDFRSLYVPIGSYIEVASPIMPLWMQGCSVLPFLPCNGGSFSAATFPTLAAVLGGTVLPNSVGRARFNYDSSGTLITVAGCGTNGQTMFAQGGDQRMPTHLHSITDVTHDHNVTTDGALKIVGGGSGVNSSPVSYTVAAANIDVIPALSGITGTQNAGAGGAANMPPFYIGGITLIRSF